MERTGWGNGRERVEREGGGKEGEGGQRELGGKRTGTLYGKNSIITDLKGRILNL